MLKKTFLIILLLFSVYSIYLNAGSIYRGETARLIVVVLNILILVGYFKKLTWARKAIMAFASLLIIGGGGMWLAALFGVALPETADLLKKTLVFLIGSFFLFCSLVYKEWFLPSENSDQDRNSV
jgi:hypothetical protein